MWLDTIFPFFFVSPSQKSKKQSGYPRLQYRCMFSIEPSHDQGYRTVLFKSMLTIRLWNLDTLTQVTWENYNSKTLEGKILANQDQFAKFASIFHHQHFALYSNSSSYEVCNVMHISSLTTVKKVFNHPCKSIARGHSKMCPFAQNSIKTVITM